MEFSDSGKSLASMRTHAWSIRRATPADAEALSSVSARAFRETFGHLYPDADLQQFLRDSYSVAAYAALLADPAMACWLLEGDACPEQGRSREPLGYALAGACALPHPEVAAGDGELKRLYLLPRVQNGGLGSRLFRAALDWLERGGPRTLWIGVWSENLGAQRFYARHGFQQVGEYEFPVGRVRDREFILRRPAAEKGSG